MNGISIAMPTMPLSPGKHADGEPDQDAEEQEHEPRRLKQELQRVYGAGDHVRLHVALLPLLPAGIAPETCKGVKPMTAMIAPMIAMLGWC